MKKLANKLAQLAVLLVLMLSLSACGSYQPADITISQDFAIIHPVPPAQLNLYDSPMMVLNKDIIKTLAENDDPKNLICISPDGYENLVHNISEYERYIEQQKQIIDYYRKTVPSVN